MYSTNVSIYTLNSSLEIKTWVCNLLYLTLVVFTNSQATQGLKKYFYSIYTPTRLKCHYNSTYMLNWKCYYCYIQSIFTQIYPNIYCCLSFLPLSLELRSEITFLLPEEYLVFPWCGSVNDRFSIFINLKMSLFYLYSGYRFLVWQGGKVISL